MKAITAHEVDIVVGKNLRAFRTARGISQERLANAMGVTFQQVQKYEGGTNRMAASRLFVAAKALDISVADFFQDAGGAGVEGA